MPATASCGSGETACGTGCPGHCKAATKERTCFWVHFKQPEGTSVRSILTDPQNDLKMSPVGEGARDMSPFGEGQDRSLPIYFEQDGEVHCESRKIAKCAAGAAKRFFDIFWYFFRFFRRNAYSKRIFGSRFRIKPG